MKTELEIKDKIEELYKKFNSMEADEPTRWKYYYYAKSLEWVLEPSKYKPTMDGKNLCYGCDECFESEAHCLDSLACNLTEDSEGCYTLIRFMSKCPKGKW